MRSFAVVGAFFVLASCANGQEEPVEKHYLYNVRSIFTNVTTTPNDYIDWMDGFIVYKNPITHETPLEVVYFFAREKDHVRFDQIDERIPFCELFDKTSLARGNPTLNYRLRLPLGVSGQQCPIPRSIRFSSFEFPKNFWTERPIPCDIMNFFFDIFVTGTNTPLLTLWAQFETLTHSPACIAQAEAAKNPEVVKNDPLLATLIHIKQTELVIKIGENRQRTLEEAQQHRPTEPQQKELTGAIIYA